MSQKTMCIKCSFPILLRINSCWIITYTKFKKINLHWKKFSKPFFFNSKQITKIIKMSKNGNSKFT